MTGVLSILLFGTSDCFATPNVQEISGIEEFNFKCFSDQLITDEEEIPERNPNTPI